MNVDTRPCLTAPLRSIGQLLGADYGSAVSRQSAERGIGRQSFRSSDRASRWTAGDASCGSSPFIDQRGHLPLPQRPGDAQGDPPCASRLHVALLIRSKLTRPNSHFVN